MASMRKKGKSGHYYARFYDRNRTPSRKEVPLRTTRKDIARRRLTKLEGEYERGEYDPWLDQGAGARQALTLAEAKEQFLASKRETVQPRTLDTYDGILSRWIKNCPVGLLLRDVQAGHL